jgi:hypothetical protein
MLWLKKERIWNIREFGRDVEKGKYVLYLGVVRMFKKKTAREEFLCGVCM